VHKKPKDKGVFYSYRRNKGKVHVDNSGLYAQNLLKDLSAF
jgi:hypothetical protein